MQFFDISNPLMIINVNGQKTWKRFVIPPEVPVKEIDSWLLWGQKNSADAVIIPPEKADLRGEKRLSRKTKLIFVKAVQYGLNVEIGGFELSQLVPRKHFLFNKEIFRMEQGIRKKQIHFCPTNPDTINVIQKEARNLFSRFPEVAAFHLWPDRNNENIWCNCPSCRAFSFAEQNLIAVNAAADILAEIHPDALLSYIDLPDEEKTIQPRKNMFAVDYSYGIV